MIRGCRRDTGMSMQAKGTLLLRKVISIAYIREEGERAECDERALIPEDRAQQISSYYNSIFSDVRSTDASHNGTFPTYVTFCKQGSTHSLSCHTSTCSHTESHSLSSHTDAYSTILQLRDTITLAHPIVVDADHTTTKG